MRKTMLAGLAAMALVAGSAGPAFGHASSGAHEEDCVDDSTGETVPHEDGSCPDGSTAVFDNDVECEEDRQTANVPLGSVFVGAPNPNEVPTDVDLGVELCADGDEELTLIEGRIGVEAGGGDLTNPDPGNQPIGVAVFADGDRDNPEEAQGWVSVQLNTRDGLVIRCDDSEGNQDATHPTPQLPDTPDEGIGNGEDGLDDCG